MSDQPQNQRDSITEARSTDEAPTAPETDWLEHLVRATETVSPLVTRKTPEAGRLPQDRRGRLAALLGVVGMTVALIQVVLQIFDLATRPLLPLVKALPYITVVLMIAGIGLAIYAGVRAETTGQRRRAGIAFALLLTAGLAWAGWRLFDLLTPPAGFLIAVGEFDGQNASQRVDFARRIAEHLRSELGSVEPPVVVERTLETYTDTDAAKDAGKNKDAGMVIWGWYDDLGVSSHVEVLHLPVVARPILQLDASFPAANALRGVKLSPAQQPTLSSISQLVNVPATLPDVQLFAADGPNQLAYLTSAIIGLGYAASGETDKAKEMFDRALQKADETQLTDGEEVVRHQRAMLSYQAGDYAAARADLEQALRISPDFYEAHNLLAIVLSEGCTPARDFGAALAEAQTAATLRPDDPLAHRLLASIYLQLRRPADAIVAARRFQDLAPTSPEAFTLLAAAYTAAGDDAGAATARKSALQLWLDATNSSEKISADVLFSLADAYASLGDYANAEATYQRAGALSPNDPRTARGLANVAYWQGRMADAVTAYRRWEELEPDQPTPALLLGLVYLQQEEANLALAEFTRAAHHAGCDPVPHILLGQQQFLAGDTAAALESYQRGLAIEPENPIIHLALGSAAYVGNDYATAKPWLESTLELDPANAYAHYILGDILASEGDLEEARQSWEKALSLLPNTPDLTRAYALERLGRRDAAVAEYERLLAVDESSDLRGFLANLFEQIGDTDRAIGEYQRALELDSENTVAALGLANLAMKVGKLEIAVDAFERYLAHAPMAFAHTMAALAYTGLRENDRAVEHMRAAIALEPDNAEHLVELGQFLVRLGRLVEAEKTLDRAEALDPNAVGLHVGRAALAYQQCKPIEAVAAIERAAALAPEESLYQGMLAGYLLSAGKAEAAQEVVDLLRARPIDDVLAHLLAGSSFVTLSQFDEAERELTRVMAAAGAPELFVSLGAGSLGDLYLIDDKLSAAADAYRRSLTAFPAHAGAQLALGDIELMNHDVNGALDAYAQAKPLLGPFAMNFGVDAARTVEIGLSLRAALMQQRSETIAGGDAELVKAKQLLDQWLKDAPHAPAAHFLNALLHSIEGDRATAASEYAAATACDATLESTRQLTERFLERVMQ